MSLRLRKVVFASLYLWLLYSRVHDGTIIKHTEWSPWPWWREWKDQMNDLTESRLTTAVQGEAHPWRDAWGYSGAVKVALGREWSLKLLYSSNFPRSQRRFSCIGSLDVIYPPWTRTRSSHSWNLITAGQEPETNMLITGSFFPLYLIHFTLISLCVYFTHKDAVKAKLWEAFDCDCKEWKGLGSLSRLSFLSPNFLMCKIIKVPIFKGFYQDWIRQFIPPHTG